MLQHVAKEVPCSWYNRDMTWGSAAYLMIFNDITDYLIILDYAKYVVESCDQYPSIHILFIILCKTYASNIHFQKYLNEDQDYSFCNDPCISGRYDSRNYPGIWCRRDTFLIITTLTGTITVFLTVQNILLTISCICLLAPDVNEKIWVQIMCTHS